MRTLGSFPKVTVLQEGLTNDYNMDTSVPGQSLDYVLFGACIKDS